MRSSQLDYRADIDGLRAVAVVPVVLYHAGFSWFSGGFVGVDVFFVISGYLITSIVAAEIQRGEFRLAHFYERRLRRLFPALFCVIFACSVAGYLLLLPQELEDFGQSAAATAWFASNFLFFSEAGYFDAPAALKPLLHTWSLAIEEQYYLLFPAFLLFVNKKCHGKLMGWTAGLFAVSLVISAWSVSAAPDAAFYLLPSRTWELLLGSMLALAPRFDMPRWLREAGVAAGLAAIGWAVVAYDGATAFPGLAAMLPCLGTALVIAAGAGSEAGATWGVRLLRVRVLVFLGLISYSLYLWHWPVLVFAQHYRLAPLDSTSAMLAVCAALGLAVLSWRFVERPFRGAHAVLTRRGIFVCAGLAMATATAIGIVFDATEGAPARLPVQVARLVAVGDDKPPERRRCEGLAPARIAPDTVCRVNDSAAPVSFAVWGDSHAMAMMPAFRAASLKAGLNGYNLSSNGCVPLLGVWRPRRDPQAECAGFTQASLGLMQAEDGLRTVFLVARWARHLEGTVFGEESGETLWLADIDQVATDAETNGTIFTRALSATLQALRDSGLQVVIIGPVPEIGRDVPRVLAKAAWRREAVDMSLPLSAHLERQANVHSVLAQSARAYGARYADPAAYLCGAACPVVSANGVPLYFDDNHLASAGNVKLGGFLDAVFAGLVHATGPDARRPVTR